MVGILIPVGVFVAVRVLRSVGVFPLIGILAAIRVLRSVGVFARIDLFGSGFARDLQGISDRDVSRRCRKSEGVLAFVQRELVDLRAVRRRKDEATRVDPNIREGDLCDLVLHSEGDRVAFHREIAYGGQRVKGLSHLRFQRCDRRLLASADQIRTVTGNEHECQRRRQKKNRYQRKMLSSLHFPTPSYPRSRAQFARREKFFIINNYTFSLFLLSIPSREYERRFALRAQIACAPLNAQAVFERNFNIVKQY